MNNILKDLSFLTHDMVSLHYSLNCGRRAWRARINSQSIIVFSRRILLVSFLYIESTTFKVLGHLKLKFDP